MARTLRPTAAPEGRLGHEGTPALAHSGALEEVGPSVMPGTRARISSTTPSVSLTKECTSGSLSCHIASPLRNVTPSGGLTSESAARACMSLLLQVCACRH